MWYVRGEEEKDYTYSKKKIVNPGFIWGDILLIWVMMVRVVYIGAGMWSPRKL